MVVRILRPLPRSVLVQLLLVWLGINALALVDVDSAAHMVLDPLLKGTPALDWDLYREAGRLIASGQSPYEARAEACGDVCAFRHSPLVAWFYSLPFDIEWFRIAQLAGLLLLPPALGLLVIGTWAFWADVAMGQQLTFGLVLAVLALRGNRWAGIAFLVFATLMPRPLMLPVAIWLLVRKPGLRIPFLAVSAVHLVGVVLSGWAGPWATSLLSATDDTSLLVNYSPSRYLGIWWVVIGVPLAWWLYRRGQLGLASLAVSPYLFPYYLLMGLVPPHSSRQGGADEVQELKPPIRGPDRSHSGRT